MYSIIDNIINEDERLIHFEYDLEKNNFTKFLPTEAYSNTYNSFEEVKRIILEDIAMNQSFNHSENAFKDNVYHSKDSNSILKITYFNHAGTICGIARDVSSLNRSIRAAEQLLKTKDTFIEINHAIVEMNNINDMFDFVLNKVTHLFGISKYSSILKLHDDGCFRFISSIGYDKEMLSTFALNYEDSIEYQLTDGSFNEPMVIGTFPMNSELDDFKPKYASTSDSKTVVTSLLAPIHYKEVLYGMICIDSVIPGVFNDEHIDIMKYVGEQLSLIVEKQILFEKILRISKYDSLTNLLNRNQLEQEIKSIINNKESFAFANMDLNGLKYINDTYGHNAGDAVLASFSNELLNIPDSLAFRLGGDEFAFIIKHQSINYVNDLLASLLIKIETSSVAYDKETIPYSFSYGVTEYPSESDNFENILKTSDKKMYTFKKKYKRKKII